MASSLSRLRRRFPVGTKFVIEGRQGGEGQMQIFSRYLEFPDGTFLPLPAGPAKRKSAPASRRRARRSRARSHLTTQFDQAASANGRAVKDPAIAGQVGHWPRRVGDKSP